LANLGSSIKPPSSVIGWNLDYPLSLAVFAPPPQGSAAQARRDAALGCCVAAGAAFAARPRRSVSDDVKKPKPALCIAGQPLFGTAQVQLGSRSGITS
jgi:hypothetical protein